MKTDFRRWADRSNLHHASWIARAKLAGRLLKLANSAFFKTGRPVGTLTQAIVRIFRAEPRNRVITQSLSLFLHSKTPDFPHLPSKI